MPLGEVLPALLVLAVVMGGALLTGTACARLGQPRVLGPIVLGVAVGTGLAALPPTTRSTLVSASSQSLLADVGAAGLLLLMFAVGAELRDAGPSTVRPPRRTLTPYALAACVLLPIIACALAAWPFAGLLGSAVHPGPYGWLFVGVAAGVTAVPVLVSIVHDLGVGEQPTARSAVRIAILTDVVAWSAVTVLMIITTDLAALSVPALLLGILLLIAVSVVLPKIIERRRPRGGVALAVMIGCALLGATATQLLGLHPAMGAVVAGFCCPPALTADPARLVLTRVVDVLLPAFFVSTAMAVPLQGLGGQSSWLGLWCLIVLVAVAFGAKLLSGLVFGKAHGWARRSSLQLGVLLNCRGVTEIAIASVGLQAGLIGPFAFAVLCVLAIITTVSTAPLHRVVAGRHGRHGRDEQRSHMSAGLAARTTSG